MTTKLADAEKLRRLRRVVRAWESAAEGTEFDALFSKHDTCCEPQWFIYLLRTQGIIPRPRKRKVKR